MLFWMSFVCPFEYWQFTLFAVLNGVGKQHVVLKNSILHIVISVICSYFLIPIPSIRIYGFVIGFCASAVLICLWNLADLKRIPNIHIDYANIFIKPLFAFIGMLIVIKCCNLYLAERAFQSFNMTLSSITGLVFFFLILFFMGIFTPRQLKNTFALK